MTARPIFLEKQEPSCTPSMDLTHLIKILEIKNPSSTDYPASLPFSPRDVTAGVENEFQTMVQGKKQDVDLAIAIEASSFYRNMLRRTASGDSPRKMLDVLEELLTLGKDNWPGSWVRLPVKSLNTYAHHIFQSDLKSDKTDPGSIRRSDADSFTIQWDGETFIRVPVSYLLKLALADAMGEDQGRHPFIRITGEKMMGHFLNDNTSPETFSFYPIQGISSRGAGSLTARETLIRFVFTQLLVQYAQIKFYLNTHGQTVKVFFSASPPLWQKALNDVIPDTFYRHLFMSPCLSGWNRGQEKHEYMKVCHKVLSRSRINSLPKLKEAGIINTNLAILPNSSNISLANNGTHISMGSKKLGRLLQNPDSGFTPLHEKQLGDLVIKIVEHFLPLFPGTYSSAPCRLNFEEFHPEHVMGFLPHEMDYTHLRMIWRRWKKKANISILGKPVTPFGPVWLDRLIGRIFCLKGDFIPDYRLIDYFVSLMSTHESPCLDGTMGNGDRLKKDLSQMGIFDTRMPLYQLVRIRSFSDMGFSGFEHRYHSIFENIITDMAGALDLQNLITTLAWHYIVSGEITHADIPDTPHVESERRQIFFGSAVNLPTFYVKANTGNRFLKKIISKVPKTRSSRRYPGYIRVLRTEYLKTLVEIIQSDGRELVIQQRMKCVISDLKARLNSPEVFSSSGRLITGILSHEKNKSPMAHKGEDFNHKAERYYIETLRKKHMEQGINLVQESFSRLELWAESRDPACREAIYNILDGEDLMNFITSVKTPFLEETMSMEQLKKLIHLIILYVDRETRTCRPHV